MASDLIASLNANAACLTLKEAYSILESNEQTDIPFLVWLLENPDSPLALPGKIYLREHDYIHILLGCGQSAQDEAFVIGVTMGSNLKTNWLHLAIFKFFTRHLYPKPYQFSQEDLRVFDLGFDYGRRIQVKQLNEIDFEPYQNQTIASLRKMFGIDVDYAYEEIEELL